MGKDILPGLVIEGCTWNEINIAAVPRTQLAPGQAITGVTQFSDFNVVEDKICQQLVDAAPAKGALIMNETVAKSRLAKVLHPANLNSGRLTGSMYLFPLDIFRLEKYNNRPGRLRADTQGLGMFVVATALTSKGEPLGVFEHELFYYPSRLEDVYVTTRFVGGERKAELEKAIKERNAKSRRRA